jgi:hypothetical protein
LRVGWLHPLPRHLFTQDDACLLFLALLLLAPHVPFQQALTEVEELRGGRRSRSATSDSSSMFLPATASSASTHFTLASADPGSGAGATVGRRRTTGGGRVVPVPLCFPQASHFDGLPRTCATCPLHVFRNGKKCITGCTLGAPCHPLRFRPPSPFPPFSPALPTPSLPPSSHAHLVACLQVVWTPWTNPRWSPHP